MNNNTEILITLLNKLFLKNKHITSLSDLMSSEKFLSTMMIEIEPKLEILGSKIEINEDSNFGIRYANIVSLLNCIEKYLTKCPDKERFTNFSGLKNSVIINDLLKNDEEQLINLSEIILFISSISSRKDYYLDRIGELDDVRLANAFFSHIEKYIELDARNDETFHSHLDKSFVQFNQRMKEEYEKERESFIATLKENEKTISHLTSKTEFLENNLNEMSIKLKDKQRELDFIKSTYSQNIRVQEELLKDNLINSELIGKLNQKELEFNDLKRENDNTIKQLNDEVIRMRDKLDTYEDRIQEYKSLKAQNDKLNLKIKELSITKERKKEYEDIHISLDDKNKQIQNLLKEKQLYANEIDKLKKEFSNEKEKFRLVEFERKKIEYDFNELKREIGKMELHNLKNYQYFQNISDVGRGNNLNNSELDMKLFDIGGCSFITDACEYGNTNLNNNPNTYNKKISDKEYFEIKNEKNELKKLYKAQIDDIHKLIDEKDRLLNSIDSYKLEIEKHITEKERLGIDREKLEIIIQKSDLECQKLKIHIERFENEKKRNEEEIKDLNDRIEILNQDKNFRLREIEQLKSSVSYNKSLNDKLLFEKQTIFNEFQNLQSEFEKLKNKDLEIPSQMKNKIKISSKNAVNIGNINNSNLIDEINLLKNELQTLKLSIIQKDDIIKNLRDKLKNLEGKYNESEKVGQEYVKLSEDLEFYRRSYEEQKNRVNREHELISESLLDLAMQFVTLKSELQKKMNSNETYIKK